MQKFTLPLLVLVLLIVGCSKEPAVEIIHNQDPMSESEINKLVFEKLNAHDEFWWHMVDAHVAWSALVNSDNVLSIGYKPAHVNNLNEIIHQIDLTDSDWTNARETAIQHIADLAKKDDKNFTIAADVRTKDNLPVIHVHTSSYAVIEGLREMTDIIRYVEPMGYGIEPDVNPSQGVDNRSDSGCGSAVSASYVYSADYTNTSPSAKIPWTFTHGNINVPGAWAYSKGSGATICVIDTGTSDNQSKLRGDFTSGESSGRYVVPKSTHWTTTGMWWWKETTLDSPHDQCGHGTQMSGTAAGPKGYGGATTGIAYKANLVPYRATTDVVINESSEKDGVSDALVDAANRSDVDIISMSIGDVFSSGQVSDAVIYAYNSNVFIVAAAGTSLSWTSWYGVIFPASMSQTVAATGVTDASNYSRCAYCHDGSAVDFVVQMQRTNDDGRTSLTLPMSGNGPGYVGGSSTATAHTAGVAALIKAYNPSFGRAAILNRLKFASQNYPSRSGSYGYGTYDARKAVRGW